MCSKQVRPYLCVLSHDKNNHVVNLIGTPEIRTAVPVSSKNHSKYTRPSSSQEGGVWVRDYILMGHVHNTWTPLSTHSVAAAEVAFYMDITYICMGWGMPDEVRYSSQWHDLTCSSTYQNLPILYISISFVQCVSIPHLMMCSIWVNTCVWSQTQYLLMMVMSWSCHMLQRYRYMFKHILYGVIKSI